MDSHSRARSDATESVSPVLRAAYLELTYGCGEYRPYETLVAEAARHFRPAASLPATRFHTVHESSRPVSRSNSTALYFKAPAFRPTGP